MRAVAVVVDSTDPEAGLVVDAFGSLAEAFRYLEEHKGNGIEYTIYYKEMEADT